MRVSLRNKKSKNVETVNLINIIDIAYIARNKNGEIIIYSKNIYEVIFYEK